MSSYQGNSERREEQPNVKGAANIIGSHNQAIAVPVTVHVNVHAVGMLTPYEHDLLVKYRLISDAGKKTIERAVKRAMNLDKAMGSASK